MGLRFGLNGADLEAAALPTNSIAGHEGFVALPGGENGGGFG